MLCMRNGVAFMVCVFLYCFCGLSLRVWRFCVSGCAVCECFRIWSVSVV